jgi:hypothetical protein
MLSDGYAICVGKRCENSERKSKHLNPGSKLHTNKIQGLPTWAETLMVQPRAGRLILIMERETCKTCLSPYNADCHRESEVCDDCDHGRAVVFRDNKDEYTQLEKVTFLPLL